MLDWLIANLSTLQGGIVRSLAAELRAGGIGTAVLAFSLGALHALTPGHGKRRSPPTSWAKKHAWPKDCATSGSKGHLD
jgi:hypothetical protein